MIQVGHSPSKLCKISTLGQIPDEFLPLHVPALIVISQTDSQQYLILAAAQQNRRIHKNKEKTMNTHRKTTAHTLETGTVLTHYIPLTEEDILHRCKKMLTPRIKTVLFIKEIKL